MIEMARQDGCVGIRIGKLKLAACRVSQSDLGLMTTDEGAYIILWLKRVMLAVAWGQDNPGYARWRAKSPGLRRDTKAE